MYQQAPSLIETTKGPVLNMPINGMQPVHEHEMSPLENPNVKKTRVRSPGAVQREIQDKRQARERKRNEERAQRDAAWREAKRQQFFREIMQCMPPPGSTTKSAPEPIRRAFLIIFPVIPTLIIRVSYIFRITTDSFQ